MNCLRTPFRFFVAASLATVTLCLAPHAHANSASSTQSLDTAAASHYKPDQPGATVIVVKDGKTLLRKAYGLADVEKQAAMTPEAVLRIGSVTKQFTAVAIMMLEEQGKLSVRDDITKRLSNYPAPAEQITIEHLLTHTSGIPSYTNKPEYGQTMAEARSVAQMIEAFKNDPLEFKPGSQYRYNNSGYFLLGAIVEQVSGMSYAEFLAKQIFIPLGMKDSAYEGFERAGGGKRIEGYGRRQDKVIPIGASVHMSQPYAAGALISTIDDLARWDDAVTNGRLLKAETWKRVFTPYTLTNGNKTSYGYGWNIGKLRGRESAEHGGAINGFLSQVIRVPGDRVFVAVLANSNAVPVPPSVLAEKLAAIGVGDPYPEMKAVKLDAKTLDEVVGVYKIDEKETRTIRRDGETMYLQRTGRPRLQIQPTSASEYFIENTLSTLRFNRNASGEVVSMTITQQGTASTSQRISSTPPKERTAIRLSDAQLDSVVGEYQLTPQLSITIRREGSRLMAQATGQSANEIFAESDRLFFLKVIDAQLEFTRAASGEATDVILIQKGRRLPGKRVK